MNCLIAGIRVHQSGVFELAELEITKLSRVFHNATRLSTAGFLVIPCILILKAIVTKSVTSSTFEAPFHD